MHIHLKAFILLISLGVIWGSGYVIAKYCVTHGVPPLGYSFWQSLGPAILLSIFLGISRRKFPFKISYFRYYVVCGIFGIAFPNSLMYFTAQYLPAGLLAVLVNVVPIITYPIALAFMQEKWSWKRISAVIIGFIGIMMLVLPHAHFSGTHIVSWSLLLLLTPLSFAFCSVFISAYRPIPSNALSLACGMLIVSSIILLPIVLYFHKFYSFHFPLQTTDWLVLLEILLSSIGYVIFFRLIKIAGPVYYSIVGGVVSITGLIWGKVIFGEVYHWPIYLAVALILAGIALLSTK